ncbi:porphobilinogen synthase [Senegalia massiliensis]|uniref:Delta-aminolevulinic acid dehydratase n=1 Tax=Senegalia massiliensis TaxID=1720316 RepID=A0A845QVB5_9CLOT|nr:porphobilinogen synthase [Senegalia massiliensis]
MELKNRPRRLRTNGIIRNLVRETKLNIEDLVYPLFVVEGENIKKEIPSLPNNYHFSIDKLVEEVKELTKLGIHYIMLFGLPDKKDNIGSSAYSDDGIVQRAIIEVKKEITDIYIITDICMCQYTDHGHCGLLTEDGKIENDTTVEKLSKIAVSHAKAGADMVAPSDMMDGRIAHMRRELDSEGFKDTPIMSYSIKYASSFYGPFRDAAHSTPSFGDRSSYQMDFTNPKESLREAEIDIDEGADIIMVKPALSYLDIIRRVDEKYNIPIAAYNVSGEYAMIKMAIKNGLMDEKVIYESLLSIKRAGADIIITYFAKEIAEKLRGRN